MGTCQLSGLGASYVKFRFGIAVPVSVEERKLEEEAVEGVSQGGNGGRIGVPRQALAVLDGRESFGELEPGIAVIWVCEL